MSTSGSVLASPVSDVVKATTRRPRPRLAGYDKIYRSRWSSRIRCGHGRLAVDEHPVQIDVVTVRPAQSRRRSPAAPRPLERTVADHAEDVARCTTRASPAPRSRSAICATRAARCRRSAAADDHSDQSAVPRRIICMNAWCPSAAPSSRRTADDHGAEPVARSVARRLYGDHRRQCLPSCGSPARSGVPDAIVANGKIVDPQELGLDRRRARPGPGLGCTLWVDFRRRRHPDEAGA